MHGDEVARADELVELDQVGVAHLLNEWAVQDEEHVIAVVVNHRHVVAIAAVVQRHLVEAEVLPEDGRGIVTPLRDVQPEVAVLTLAELREILDRMVLDRGRRDEPQIHDRSKWLERVTGVGTRAVRRYRATVWTKAGTGGNPRGRKPLEAHSGRRYLGPMTTFATQLENGMAHGRPVLSASAKPGQVDGWQHSVMRPQARHRSDSDVAVNDGKPVPSQQ